MWHLTFFLLFDYIRFVCTFQFGLVRRTIKFRSRDCPMWRNRKLTIGRITMYERGPITFDSRWNWNPGHFRHLFEWRNGIISPTVSTITHLLFIIQGVSNRKLINFRFYSTVRKLQTDVGPYVILIIKVIKTLWHIRSTISQC